MTQPTVSIVVVFRDTRDFLDEAVQSVFAQSYQQWELLLVDDGSSDGTDAIAREHADGDTRIRYLHHPGRANLGISATRNLGLREARGAYVAQLDSDDVWRPDHLAHHVAVLEAHPDVALLYGPVERWYSWRESQPNTPRDFIARPLPRYDTVLAPPALLPIILQTPYGVPLGFVARRAAMQEVGGYEDEFRGMYDDQVFFAKLALRHRVYVTSRSSYRYRRHEGSIVWVTNAEGEKLPNRLRYLTWLQHYLDRQEVRDRRVRRALAQELWKCHHPELERRRARIVDLSRRVRGRLTRIRRRLLSPLVS